MSIDFAVVGGGKEIKRKEVIDMPFGDGTGPRGLGPMTGRGAGFCTGFGKPGFASPMPGYPYPRGYGYSTPTWPRWGYGFGRGWRRWRSYVYHGW